MSGWLIGHAGTLWTAAAKAGLMYAVALLALRVAHRRTLSQWTAIDFAAAVAIGAVMGRTAIASGQSFATGAVALVTFLAAHTVATYARYGRLFAKLVDHRVRVLVAHGQIRPTQLLRCGVTRNDLFALLRQSGVTDLAELRYVLYETKGTLTVVRHDDPAAQGAIVSSGLRDAAGYP